MSVYIGDKQIAAKGDMTKQTYDPNQEVLMAGGIPEYVESHSIDPSEKGNSNGVATLDSNGKLSASQVPIMDSAHIIVKTAVLPRSSWIANTQTIVDPDLSGNSVIVSPAPSDYIAAARAIVYADNPVNSSLTFHCDTIPSKDISVNLLILIYEEE